MKDFLCDNGRRNLLDLSLASTNITQEAFSNPPDNGTLLFFKYFIFLGRNVSVALHSCTFFNQHFSPQEI